MRAVLISFFLFICSLSAATAQAIQGEVVDAGTGQPIEYVAIQNIFNKSGIVTGADGKFLIMGLEEELLEFRKIGYKTVRIRVPRVIPPYFKIMLSKGEIELPEFELYTHGRSKDYKSDSVKYGELYKTELSFPKMSGVQSLRSPFSALSKSNRQKWAFQEKYEYFQKEKYVDYAFNDKLITSITGFTGDTLLNFKQRYRPSYDQVRNQSEYFFFLYIRQSAERFKRSFSRGRNPG